MSANPAPGFAKRPDHRIALKPAAARVRVMFKGKLVADSAGAVFMEEGSYPAVYYFPRRDVRMELLERTEHHTYCPFKGQASYYSLKGGPENAVWSYEQPYDEVMAIRELVAFYPEKVDSIAVG